jgi:hypothetical protein
LAAKLSVCVEAQLFDAHGSTREHCVDVVDRRADGELADDTDYATCQMCGRQSRSGYVVVLGDTIGPHRMTIWEAIEDERVAELRFGQST